MLKKFNRFFIGLGLLSWGLLWGLVPKGFGLNLSYEGAWEAGLTSPTGAVARRTCGLTSWPRRTLRAISRYRLVGAERTVWRGNRSGSAGRLARHQDAGPVPFLAAQCRACRRRRVSSTGRSPRAAPARNPATGRSTKPRNDGAAHHRSQ